MARCIAGGQEFLFVGVFDRESSLGVVEIYFAEFQKAGSDVRWPFRTILNTKAYQREVRSTYTASGRTPFAAVCPSRLRSDQILDSLVQVLDLPLDEIAIRREMQPV